MAGLPTQQQMMRSFVRTLDALGGLQARMIRLATDVGPGIDVNRSVGRKLDDKRWEVDRVVPQGGTIALPTDLADDKGKHMPIGACSIVVHPKDDTKADVEVKLSVNKRDASTALPGVPEVLVTLIVDFSQAPPGAGPRWSGVLVHDDGTGAAGKPGTATPYPVRFDAR